MSDAAMEVVLSKGDEGQRLQIAGEATIYGAKPLKERLLQALGANGDLDLDLSAVTEIDTAGLQLLLSLHREAQEAGRLVRVSALSPEVHAILKLYGLSDHFAAPTDAEGDAP